MTRGTAFHIDGRITFPDGTESKFMVSVDPADQSAGFSQWGADTRYLGSSVDLMEAMQDALRTMAEEASTA